MKIHYASDLSPLEYTLRRGIPLATHIQSLCNLFTISEDPIMFALQRKSTRLYISQSDWEDQSFSLNKGVSDSVSATNRVTIAL